jgi:DNA-binding response OmpR family regulator
MRKMLRVLLEEEGHEVGEVTNAQAGAELVGIQQPDVVITDLGLPRRAGLETVRALRKHGPLVKILAMTAIDPRRETSEEIGRVAGEYGACRTMLKPFSRAHLLGAVEALLVSDG